MQIDKIIELIKSTAAMLADDKKRNAVTEKGRADFVTEVDTSVQKYLQSSLSKLFPDIQFLGEEGAKADIDFSKKVWVLDPVDGTTNLIHDYRMSAVSLGLIDNGVPVMGIIYNPFTDELFNAAKGKGAYLNGKKIHVSSAQSLHNALVAFGSSPYNKELADVNFDILKKVYLASGDIRRSGSAALDLAYIACGRIDGFFEKNLKPWDYCAGICIVNEAGGKVTDMSVQAVSFEKNSDILASNGNVHNELAALM